MTTHFDSISHLSLPQLQAGFEAIAERIVRYAQFRFRHVACPQDRDDCVAEVVALYWKWFCALARRGKDARKFISALAGFAVQAVRSGRRVCGQVTPNDIMSERAQTMRGFRLEPLPASTRRSFEDLYSDVDGQRHIDAFEERLQNNTQTPVPDQVAFRCDFPQWLRTQSPRDYHLILAMSGDERTADLAKRFKMSPSRVAQLRREFQVDWERFTADSV